MIKPGKVSRDFIEGKRNRYSNPFQFYLTVSVIFFLLIGLTESYEKFQSFRTGKKKPPAIEVAKQIDPDNLKKIQTNGNIKLQEVLKELDSSELKVISTTLPQFKIDTTKVHRTTKANDWSFIGGGKNKYSRMQKYQKEHPDAEMDAALDSLKLEKTFLNRFFYNRIELGNDLINDNDKQQAFNKQLISYASISLFIFLPIFTLTLKLFYIRRKFTYVEHLVFVFHTQTVFFLLLTIFFFINFFKGGEQIIAIFFLIFLIYLFIAMRKFYRQGRFKTFIKYTLLNTVYMILATIGVAIVSAISFALY